MSYPTYFINDQPFQCPMCGVRTDFDEQSDGSQHHKCPRCTFEFNAVEESLGLTDDQRTRIYDAVVDFAQ